MRSFFVIGLVLFLITSCKELIDKENGEHFNVDEQLYSTATITDGKIQSPINILTTNAAEGNDHQINILCGDGIKVETVANTGHSVQLNFESGNTIVFDDKRYDMIQAHFHTPSEHQVDGLTFPMEMHFVNKLLTNSEQDSSAYLVIALLIKMGEENTFIKKFIGHIPTEENQTILKTNAPAWEKEWLLDEVDQTLHYYYYQGSLTTPPYTETVNWLVSKKIFEASPEQIQYINDLEGNNARHVHALFNRTIETN